MRPGYCVPAREMSDIIAYLSEVAKLVNALPGISASINHGSLWVVLTSMACCRPDTLYILCFIHFLCAGLMYFIELVTTEHKLGITTLCIKNLPPERNRSNLFLICPSLILCPASTLHFPSLSLPFSVCRTRATLFSYPISQRMCLAFSPLHPPLPLYLLTCYDFQKQMLLSPRLSAACHIH